jgi:hypothetical protein
MAGLTEWTEWPMVMVLWHDAHSNTTGWTHVDHMLCIPTAMVKRISRLDVRDGDNPTS